jgi:hypothetical protein
MRRSAAPRCPDISADRESALDPLDPISATEAGNKRMGESGIFEIKCDRVVDDADKPAGRRRPAIRAAGLVEPGMHRLELPAQTLRRDCNAHPYRKVPFGLALRLQ